MKNIDRTILLEVKRMKEIMGINNSNNYILEQGSADITDMRRAEAQLSGNQNEKSDFFNEKTTFNIGIGTEYPFIYPTGNKQFDTFPVVEGTRIFLIKKGMTSKDVIPKAKVGTVIDDLGNEHPNQEYIEEQTTVKDNTGKQIKKTIKLCLPDKAFWDMPEHIGKVYKFITPSSSEGGMFSAIESLSTTFAMSLEQKQVTASGFTDKGEVTQQKGFDAAIRCRGGDNGWGWTPRIPLFADVVTGKGYNPKDPRMLDTRSDWEVWYDHYGTWLEIGIGIAASFIGAGLATLILNVAKAAAAAGQITASLLAVLETSYGTTTALSVILQVLTEGVMMAPIIKWQIYDDRDADGLLSTIFLFIPFVSELKGVARFISGPYTKEAAKTLAEKIQREGIELIFTAGVDNPQAQAKFAKFISNLTGTELALWNRGMKIIGSKEGMESLKKTMEEMVASGGKFGKEFSEAQAKGSTETVLGKLGNVIGGENATKWAKNADKFSRFWGKNINPITARWVLPHQFVRMGIPIAIFATSFKYVYNELTPEEKVKFEENFEKTLLEDKSYFEALNKIDPYLAQSVANKRIELLTSDIEVCRKFALDPEFLNTSEGKKIKDEAAAEVIKDETEKFNAYRLKTYGTELMSTSGILTKLSLHRALLEKLKFSNVRFLSKDDMNNIPGKAVYDGIEYDLQVKVENNLVNYLINNVLITDKEIQDEKWNGPQTDQSTTTTTTIKI